MKTLKNSIVYTSIAAILYSYASTVYLGNYYRITELLNAQSAELYMMRIGYFLQALGMFLYYFLYRKYTKKFNSKYSSVVIVALSIPLTCIVQTSPNVNILIFASFFFNLITGMIIEMYLVKLYFYVSHKHLALCYGIAYAFGSIFTFLTTYFDGGVFMESPEMTVIYIIMATLAICLLIKGSDNEHNDSYQVLTNRSKKYILLLSLCIVFATVVMALGDGIYNFGRWESDADIRIVKAFYAIGLILAGFIFDKNRRVGQILTVSFLSYYIISAFLVNNVISASMMMSLGYFFMSFLSVYRYITIVDIVDEYPKYIPFVGFGLMISRVVEGLTCTLMMIFPLSLPYHIIVTLLFYSPVVVLLLLTDSIKYSSNNNDEQSRYNDFVALYNLTSREQEICKLILSNSSDDEIANALYISKPTVRFHVSNIFKKLNIKSRNDIKKLFKNI